MTAPTRVAWFNAGYAGIAGDMALGALLDAGADLDAVRAAVAELGIDGWTLDAEIVRRGGLQATRAVVATAPGDHGHRPWRDIRKLLDRPGRTAERATSVFAALAVAEGALHGVDPDDVELHEVGALDAIVDVVGTCAALERLGIDEVRCSRVAQGTGTTSAAHGTLPVPAPAVVRLLADVRAPVVGIDVDVELTTPTGAALMAALAGPDGFGPLPSLTVEATGFGAGARELAARPNTTQVVIGTRDTSPVATPGQPALVLETNVDDATGEVLAHTVARLLEAGAHDAWITPIVMKKGRPAHTVSVLADPATAAAVAEVLAAETGSLGVRAVAADKWPAARTEQVVELEGQRIRVKVTAGRAKVEHDDAAAAAVALGLTLREVLVRAEALAISQIEGRATGRGSSAR